MDELLAKLNEMLENADAEIDEINERFPGDTIDLSSWTDGNVDDAYSLGSDHGSAYAEYEVIAKIIAITEALK